MKRLVAYIRGGLGDIWPAISAIRPIMIKNNSSKFETFIITDNVYYFRSNYSRELEHFSLDMIQKLSPNIIKVSPFVNNNFKLSINDVTDELSQKAADKMRREFMFWRPPRLREFVKQFIDSDTIFIDSLFTECIMQWDIEKNGYKRIGDERAIFNFNPSKVEKDCVESLLMNEKHILIHTRKKHEGSSYAKQDDGYNQIIAHCNKNGIIPIVIGIDSYALVGDFVDMRGETPLSLEGMGHLISECNLMLGNDSGFSAMKLYQQQKDKLLIMEHPRWERSPWYFRAIKDKSNCLLLDARQNNVEKIKQSIGDYYDTQ